MAKFAKPFRGVPAGEIYPKEYGPGDACPPELESAAAALGVLESAVRASGKSGRREAKGKGCED